MPSDFDHRHAASDQCCETGTSQLLLFIVPRQASNRTGTLLVGIRLAVVREQREAGICARADAQLGNGLQLMGASSPYFISISTYSVAR
jgi:hypothetical protein